MYVCVHLGVEIRPSVVYVPVCEPGTVPVRTATNAMVCVPVAQPVIVDQTNLLVDDPTCAQVCTPRFQPK